MKNKPYATAGRKPMMAGGDTMRQKKSYGGSTRKKYAPGGRTTQSAPQQSTKEKMTSDDKLYDSMKNMSTSSLKQIAGQVGPEANAARRILRDRGDSGSFPSGSMEPVE